MVREVLDQRVGNKHFVSLFLKFLSSPTKPNTEVERERWFSLLSYGKRGVCRVGVFISTNSSVSVSVAPRERSKWKEEVIWFWVGMFLIPF